MRNASSKDKTMIIKEYEIKRADVFTTRHDGPRGTFHVEYSSASIIQLIQNFIFIYIKFVIQKV